MECAYKFNPHDFHFSISASEDDFTFREQIKEFEKDFAERFSPFVATHLWGNHSTMMLIKYALDSEEIEDFGTDLINGNVDIDTNISIDEFSERVTVYAINTYRDQDEPLFLIIDNSIANGTLILKYVSDNDNNDMPSVPVNPVLVKKM